MMKRIIIPITILIAGTLLGWCGGNLWADHVRNIEPIGFDIGTRLTYQTRGVITGAVAGILTATLSAWISRKKKNK